MGTTSTANAIFTGSSMFSAELQQSITNAVSIASQPMNQMQTELTSLTSQQTELNTLNSDFASLQSAISQIQSATGLSSLTSSVSAPAVASVALSGTPQPGTFSLAVTSPGVYATSISDDTGVTKVTDPAIGNISDASTYSLSVGSAQYTITPSGSTMQDLADALNQSGQVQAVMVNFGTQSTPDYRLALQGTQWGDLPIQLTTVDGSNPGQTLLAAQDPPGAEASYQVDGSAAIYTNTPTVTISPGVTATLLAGGTTTITVQKSNAALSAAFTNLATAYNTAMTEINKNHGQNAQALEGQSIIMELSDALHNVANYTTGNSGISSLTSLGFSFSQTGVLSFDSTAFATATTGQAAQLADFLGSATTGGFLQAATNVMNGLEDPTTGVITGGLNSLASQITAQNNDISEQQDKINQLQTTLTNQMSAADATIATMEQQFLSLQTLFTDMQQDHTQSI